MRPGCDVAGGAYGLVYITSVKIKLLGARPHALSAILLEAMDAARKNLAKAESS